ncbi:MAG TPA: hypothetical protein VGG14_12235 [Candidatus Sulfotelmatobacter sp.]
MSALNGDKSRFNRERKQKIARRKRIRKLLSGGTTRKSPGVLSRTEPKSVPA